MTTPLLSRTLPLLVVSLLVALAACSTPAGNATTAPSRDTAAPTTSVATSAPRTTPEAPPSVDTPVERAAWEALMAPTGEYAAAASYAAVIDAFGEVQPYARIEAAEQRHIAALTRQLQRFGVTVPENPYLGRIPAPADLQTAATAWADGEVANVALYDRLLDQARDDGALTRVFTNLRRASAEQHLPAFEAAAANGGTTG